MNGVISANSTRMSTRFDAERRCVYKMLPRLG